MYICNITNKMVLNFIIYISTLFETSFIDSSYYIHYSEHFDIFIFKKYNGKFDLDKILKINKKNYNLDPSGGYNYYVNNSYEREYFSINYKNNHKQEYLSNIIDITNSSINTFYKKYYNYITK